MAIKIITPGKIRNPQDDLFQTTCLECHCVFQYQRCDIKVEQERDLREYTRILDKKSITCPQCMTSSLHHEDRKISEG